MKPRKKRFVCAECGFNFSVMKLYQRHMRLKHPEKVCKRSYYPHGTCGVCRKVIAVSGEGKSVRSSLLLHYEEFHDERLIVCEVEDCGRKFVSPTEAKWHHKKDHLKVSIISIRYVLTPAK